MADLEDDRVGGYGHRGAAWIDDKKELARLEVLRDLTKRPTDGFGGR